MNLSIGIVGLPNVGKSTLFNALLKRQQALVANYPFATIEPNVGVVAVPDPRLEKLAEITAREMLKQVQHDNGVDDKSKWPPIKPATVNFVDIAGLVKGASEGAGLGNKFLSHIREVSVIAHVVRAFEDGNVIREGSVGVREDYETINTELILADLQTIENSKGKASRIKGKVFENAIQKLSIELNSGKRAFEVDLSDEERESVLDLSLLTFKPEIIVLNVSEEDYKSDKLDPIVNQYTSILGVTKAKLVVISAKIESELAGLTDDEQVEYLKDLGLNASGLERLIQKAYEELGLISFLTTGEKEVRAWTIRKGLNAQLAAGEIHTDFIKKFIKAEVVPFNIFVEYNGWKGAREHGKAGLEGKDYVVGDGDVIEFRIGS